MVDIAKIGNVISGYEPINSFNACFLSIGSIVYKLKNPGQYDIGGCYDQLPEVWFFFTTTMGPGDNYLLNIFSNNIYNSAIKIEISSSNRLIKSPKGKWQLPAEYESVVCRANVNANFHIKTYRFSKNDLKIMQSGGSTLYIPFNVVLCADPEVHQSIAKRIKLSHDFGEKIRNQKKTDFNLISKFGREFNVHKILLLAHSTVLKDLIKDLTDNCLVLDLDDEYLELLIDYLYNGILQPEQLKNCEPKLLLSLADKYQLGGISHLVQSHLSQQITEANAIELALLAQEYKLANLENDVFRFIKCQPSVLDTKDWQQLNNVELAKKLVQYVYKK